MKNSFSFPLIMYHILTYFLKSSESKRSIKTPDEIDNKNNISLFVSPLIMYHILTYFLKSSESKGIRMTTSPPPLIKIHERELEEEEEAKIMPLYLPS